MDVNQRQRGVVKKGMKWGWGKSPRSQVQKHVKEEGVIVCEKSIGGLRPHYEVYMKK